MRTLILTAAAALAASCATAQDAGSQPTQAKAAPCSSEIFHQFDFWIGEWEVFAQNGAKAGENNISSEEYGCLLVERWTSANGTTGQSYNFVDLATNKWRQVWVSNWGTIDYSGGLNEDGAMVLEGEIAYPNGTTAPFTGTWTLNEDGSVTQLFRQLSAETNEWADWFIGTYKKIPEPK